MAKIKRTYEIEYDSTTTAPRDIERCENEIARIMTHEKLPTPTEMIDVICESIVKGV